MNELCASQCIKYIKDNLYISRDLDIVIDFTAKDGYFINGIETLVNKFLLYDESTPIHPDVRQLDFYSLDFDKFNKTFLSNLWFNDIHVIGFPPKDKIELFFKTACKFAQSISCIIPENIEYEFPSSYRCLLNKPLTTYLPNYKIQIWMKTDY